MERASLYPRPGEKSVVGVSGGSDSMLLAWAINILFDRKKLLRPLWAYVDYGVREDALENKSLVMSEAKRCGNLLTCFSAKPFPLKNFEFNAREWRMRYFIQHLKEQKARYLYLAHTVDDSLEWYWLQQWASSVYPEAIGIPVKSGYIRRPLHCLSKKQVRFAVKFLNIPYREDPTNRDISFERNFIRHIIIPKIKERYPAYLKNYAARANQLAYARKVSALALDPRPLVVRDRLGGIFLLQAHGPGTFWGQEECIRRAFFSGGGRGKLRDQVQKLIQAQANGRSGPLYLSGGVRIFMGPGGLHKISSDLLVHYREWDRILAFKKYAQIPRSRAWSLPLSEQVAPFWMVGNGEMESRLGPSQREHPLFPNFLTSMGDRGLWVRSRGDILSRCHRKNIDPETLDISPLCPVGV